MLPGQVTVLSLLGLRVTLIRFVEQPDGFSERLALGRCLVLEHCPHDPAIVPDLIREVPDEALPTSLELGQHVVSQVSNARPALVFSGAFLVLSSAEQAHRISGGIDSGPGERDDGADSCPSRRVGTCSPDHLGRRIPLRLPELGRLIEPSRSSQSLPPAFRANFLYGGTVFALLGCSSGVPLSMP